METSHLQSVSHSLRCVAARTDGIHLRTLVGSDCSFPSILRRGIGATSPMSLTIHPLVYVSRPLRRRRRRRRRGQSMPKCPPLSVIVFSLPAVSNLCRDVRSRATLSHGPLRPLAFECISLPPFRFQCGINQRLIFNLMLGWYLAVIFNPLLPLPVDNPSVLTLKKPKEN